MKLVDLSTPIIHNGVSDPPEQRANILYIDHTAGVESLLASFPGAVVADLPSGTGWAFEMLSLSTYWNAYGCTMALRADIRGNFSTIN